MKNSDVRLRLFGSEDQGRIRCGGGGNVARVRANVTRFSS